MIPIVEYRFYSPKPIRTEIELKGFLSTEHRICDNEIYVENLNCLRDQLVSCHPFNYFFLPFFFKLYTKWIKTKNNELKLNQGEKSTLIITTEKKKETQSKTHCKVTKSNAKLIQNDSLYKSLINWNETR